jgi:hypothetical protein
MTSPQVALSDLAKFTVSAIEAGQEDAYRIAGCFSHLKGVGEGRGWLYVSRTDSISGALRALDVTNMTAVFIASHPKITVHVGDRFPYLRGPRNPVDVARILEGPESWQRVEFQASDAVEFRDPEHPGTIFQRPVRENDVVLDESKSVRIREGGWDHEHCEFCMAKIGHGGAPLGYKSVDSLWLCEDCYGKYVLRRDLSFLQH